MVTLLQMLTCVPLHKAPGNRSVIVGAGTDVDAGVGSVDGAHPLATAATGSSVRKEE